MFVEITIGQVHHVLLTGEGEWSTDNSHYPAFKLGYLDETPIYCKQRAYQYGSYVSEVVNFLLSDTETNRIRAVQHILHLQKKVGEDRLNQACRRALYFGEPSYMVIKTILKIIDVSILL